MINGDTFIFRKLQINCSDAAFSPCSLSPSHIESHTAPIVHIVMLILPEYTSPSSAFFNITHNYHTRSRILTPTRNFSLQLSTRHAVLKPFVGLRVKIRLSSPSGRLACPRHARAPKHAKAPSSPNPNEMAAGLSHIHLGSSCVWFCRRVNVQQSGSQGIPAAESGPLPPKHASVAKLHVRRSIVMDVPSSSLLME